ncbi:hypothetical protein MRB53_033824 [Persea americana]|uniref:Uncharacterized protein n=1 Tax=Persea americana TaxID=3435 RepID=A0ACC2KVR7_PERAE|nr:hypothetical protein MRB53_033824 [Persea americana]
MKNPLLGTTPKEEEVEDREKKTASGFENHLGPKTRETELRLGLSSNGFEDVGDQEKHGQVFSTAERVCGGSVLVLKQRNGGLGAKRWFSETGDGFGDIWKEEKAVFDPNSHPRVVGPSPAPRALPVVGWPPVRTSRKNLAPPPKPKMETNVTPVSVEVPKKFEESMFVKVNMEGYAVGRKVDLKAHASYQSLSLALQKMFNNFFAINYFKNKEQNDDDMAVTPEHVLVYEDNEGDRMLVGDVPWEMFINTVKRLYIISGSRAPTLVAGSVLKNQQ